VLAKESIITLVIVVPLFLFFFTPLEVKKIAPLSVPFGAAVVVYFIIRASVLDSVTFNEQMIIINNSLMAASPGIERMATTIYTLGKYITLLCFPHPLSWDYSYKQIPVVGAADIKAIGSFLIYLVMGIYALIRIPKKDPVAFGILFYMITLSISSNLLVKIGSSMGERFLYTPSFGFALVIAWLLAKLSKADFSQKVAKNTKLLYAACSVILLLYSVKTIARNRVWKNNYTLFVSGVETAPNSARAHQSLAYAYTEKAQAEPLERARYFDLAVAEYKKALEILPDYSEGWYNLGWCYYLAGNREEAEKAYKKTVEADPKYSKAHNNLGVMYFEQKQYSEAISYFKKAAESDPYYTDAWGNLGACYHNLGDYSQAISYYQKALEINPGLTNIRANLENAKRLLSQGGRN
jgi:Tfp pilus assembly protein PilF